MLNKINTKRRDPLLKSSTYSEHLKFSNLRRGKTKLLLYFKNRIAFNIIPIISLIDI